MSIISATQSTGNEILECGHVASPHSEFTTGYGKDEHGKRYCYACCADRDRYQMRCDGRATLYLTCEPKMVRTGTGTLTNWPGSLEIPCNVRKGRHNMARTRYDVWFSFEGQTWHGVQYGENTQLCHCKRIKS